MSNTILSDLVLFLGTLQRSKAVKRIRENNELYALSSKQAGILVDIPGLALPLLDFQNAAVLYGELVHEALGLGVLIGDEMGLGKTPTGIALMLRLNRRTVLTVVPPSLRPNWRKEWKRFAPGKVVHVITGTKPYQLPAADVYIIGDSQLTSWESYLVLLGIDGLIVDEIHRFKDHKALRSVALNHIADSIGAGGFRVGLSGTAIVNRPSELVNVLSIVGQLEPVFGSPLGFLDRFMEQEEVWTGTRYVKVYKQTRINEIQHLNTILRGTCYVRRERKDCLSIPGKFRTPVYVDVNGKLAEYNLADRDYSKWLKTKSGKTPEEIERSLKQPKLTKLNVLRRLAGEAKVDVAIDYIQNLLDSGEPVIVFGYHKNVLGPIARHFNAPTVTGSDSDNQKDAAIEAFQNGTANIIVGNITAMGVGFTLTRSCHVVMVEQDWTPGGCNQCEDRADRFGQTRKVQVHYLLIDGTIDEYMRDVVGGKQVILDLVLTGKRQLTETEAAILHSKDDSRAQVLALMEAAKVAA